MGVTNELDFIYMLCQTIMADKPASTFDYPPANQSTNTIY